MTSRGTRRQGRQKHATWFASCTERVEEKRIWNLFHVRKIKQAVKSCLAYLSRIPGLDNLNRIDFENLPYRKPRYRGSGGGIGEEIVSIFRSVDFFKFVQFVCLRFVHIFILLQKKEIRTWAMSSTLNGRDFR